MGRMVRTLAGILAGVLLACALAGCTSSSSSQASTSSGGEEKTPVMEVSDQAAPSSAAAISAESPSSSSATSPEAERASDEAADSEGEGEQTDEGEEPASEDEGDDAGGEPAEPQDEPTPTYATFDLTEDYRDSFVHGYKGAEYQKYIVMHDTEGEGSAESVIDYWDGNGSGVAAHFIVNKDGSVVQCVPLDAITHHAGFGDAGHNEYYGVEDESRDDMVGTVPIGDWAPDYGMNSYSIGIEMVHVGGTGWYPEEQLEAVDALIAYIDAYYGFESQIIDHKAWRSGNSDTSPEFAEYLANLQDHRSCW